MTTTYKFPLQCNNRVYTQQLNFSKKKYELFVLADSKTWSLVEKAASMPTTDDNMPETIAVSGPDTLELYAVRVKS